MPSPFIRRRRFLGLSLGAPFALAGPATAKGHDRVVVVGAGLAGLHAAQLLQAAGLEVVILEARAEPGGRVRTVRDPFARGLHGEAGAIRISGAHRRVLAATRALGLTLVPFAPTNGASLFVIGGRRVTSTEDPDRAFAGLDLHKDEQGLEPAALLARYTADIPAALGDAGVWPADRTDWVDIDRLTWPEWLKSRGASPGAVALMSLGGDSSGLSALYVLRQVALHRESRTYLKIATGMDQLPKAIAAGLKGSIHYGAPVAAIDRSWGGLRVTYLENGSPRAIAADRVVLTIPAPVLADLSIDPPLAPEKRHAIRDLGYFPGTRFLFQSRDRFWHDQGLSGGARTDQPAELWDATYDLPGSAGILGMTVAGDPGRKALELNEDAALKRGLDLASASFPSLPGAFERGIVQRWGSARWSRGAFAMFRPGQMTALTAHLAAPEDRLHFAGEHTSPWTGWMEGALESAERVVSEILKSQ